MASKTYYVTGLQNGGVAKLNESALPIVYIPVPGSDSDLEAVMCVPGMSDRVFVAGSNGRIYFSIDAGVTWTLALGNYNTTSNDYPIRDLWIVDQNTAYAVGSDGSCMRSINGGATFNLTPSHPNSTGSLSLDHNSTTCHFINANVGVVVTCENTGGVLVYKTTNAGATWTVLNGGVNITDDEDAPGVHISEDQMNIIVVCRSGIYTSTDAGATFTETQTLLINDVPIGNYLTRDPNGDIIVICGYRGVYKSIDSGVTWIAVSPPVEFDPNYISGNLYTSLDGFIGTEGELWTTDDGGATISALPIETAGPPRSIWTEVDEDIPVLACPHFNINITGPSCAPDCITPGSVVQFDLGGTITPSVYPTTISFVVKNKADNSTIFEAEYDVEDDNELDSIIVNFIAPSPGHYCAEVSLPGCNTLRILCFDVCEPFDIYKDECNKWHVHRPWESNQTLFLVNVFALEGDSIITEQLWDTEQLNTFPFEVPSDGIYIFEMRDPDTKELIYSFSAFETCSLQECYMIMMDKIMCSCFDPCCKKCTDEARAQIEFSRMTLNRLVPLYLMYLGMARRNELYTTGVKLISDEHNCFLHSANQVLDKILEIIEDCGCLCPEQKNTASNRGGCSTC